MSNRNAMYPAPDPFHDWRKAAGARKCQFQGASIPMILRHEDVCRAAKDWKTFSLAGPFTAGKRALLCQI